jgi:hypothetical protein
MVSVFNQGSELKHKASQVSRLRQEKLLYQRRSIFMIAMWITFIATSLLLIILGICFINGKGGNLLAGYNTMSEEEKEKYDKPALLKAAGKLIILIGVLIMVMPVGIQLGYETEAAFGGTAVIVIITVAAVIYMNTGGRFKKKD